MSHFLKDFIRRRIAAVRDAIGRYALAGVEPLAAAVQETTGAIVRHADELKAELAGDSDGVARRLLRKLDRAIGKAAEVSDNAEKIKGGLKIGKTLYGVVGEVMQRLSDSAT